MSSELWRLGEQYAGKLIDPDAVDPDPFAMVRAWMADAIAAKVPTPNAMTLASVDERGRPAARIVLLKELDARGFTFFTSYDSRKAHDLAAHGFAALVLFWEPMHRQIRVEGTVERLAPAESDAYFSSRPRGSQLGAIASPQSAVIGSRAELEALVAAADAANPAPAARPANWGGYRVIPDSIELWQGQPSRLHDRVKYTRKSAGTTEWSRARLAP
jgi:pyridoxamine 5'-phosphate oxidase